MLFNCTQFSHHENGHFPLYFGDFLYLFWFVCFDSCIIRINSVLLNMDFCQKVHGYCFYQTKGL